MPRIFPVPLSTLKYASSVFHSGLDQRARRLAHKFRQLHLVGRRRKRKRAKCWLTYPFDPNSLAPRRSTAQCESCAADAHRAPSECASPPSPQPIPLHCLSRLCPTPSESRCPPTITTWSFSFGSVPGISATVSKPCSWSPVNFVSTFISTFTGTSRLQQPIDAAVVLNRGHNHGKCTALSVLYGCIPAWRRCRQRMFRPIPPLFFPSRLGRITPASFSSARNGATCPAAPALQIRPASAARRLRFAASDTRQSLPDLVRVALEQRLVDRRHLAHLAQQHDLARQLALVLVKVLLVIDVDVHRLARHRPIRRRRPRRRPARSAAPYPARSSAPTYSAAASPCQTRPSPPGAHSPGPCAVSSSRVHSFAFSMLGDPVSRRRYRPSAPRRTPSHASGSPSSRIRAYVARSSFSTAGCGTSQGLLCAAVSGVRAFLSGFEAAESGATGRARTAPASRRAAARVVCIG